MRTTLEVDDDVLAAARTLAAEQRLSLGAAVSILARRGLRPLPTAHEDDLVVFSVEDDAPPITPEMVSEALDEP